MSDLLMPDGMPAVSEKTCEHLNFHVHAHTHIYKGDGIEGPLDGKYTEFSLKCADCGLPFIFPQVRPDTVPKDGCANEDQTVVYHRIEPLGYVTPTQPGSPGPIKIEHPDLEAKWDNWLPPPSVE